MCGGLGCLISYLQLVIVVSAYLFNLTAAKKMGRGRGERGEREGKGRKGLLLKLISSASNQNVNLFKSK